MACLSPGFVAENMITACQARPPIWIRTRRGCRKRLESALEKNDAVFESPGQVPEAMKVVKCGASLYSLPEFDEGLFEVQDVASQAVALISAAKPGEKWLDACAGAGGKTLHLADLMEGRGSIVSQDSDERKIAELMRRAARGGFSNIRPKTADSSKKDKRRGDFFDGVLVDAPCSCSGTWRRNPDGRWRTKEGEIRRFHDLQLAILNASATSVRKGGTLIYATCSVFKAENEDVVAGFLSANPGFKLANFASPFDGKNIHGTFHVNPLSLDSDAMFIAKFRRDV
jgi:16S rRNA (cytosine967-C5)-methyltransferase